MYILENEHSRIKILQTDPYCSRIIHAHLATGYRIVDITHEYKQHYPDGSTKIINKGIKDLSSNTYLNNRR